MTLSIRCSAFLSDYPKHSAAYKAVAREILRENKIAFLRLSYIKYLYPKTNFQQNEFFSSDFKLEF
jgi:hypothetical protein